MMQRIVVVGFSGSGKTTLARNLSQKLDLTHIELDALHWLPDWQMRDKEGFRTQVGEALTGLDRWAVDGNYSKVRDIVWKQADTLVWLDYPLWLCNLRLFRRTSKRAITREDLWGTGNRENLINALLEPDGLFRHNWKVRHSRKATYLRLINSAEYAHLTPIIHRWPSETARWFEHLEKTTWNPNSPAKSPS